MLKDSSIFTGLRWKDRTPRQKVWNCVNFVKRALKAGHLASIASVCVFLTFFIQIDFLTCILYIKYVIVYFVF